MPSILTSWKEIGQYLGKGVRTVQRWEREAGLPVRRQTEPSPHTVIAISDELDGWARSRTRGPTGALAGALQREIAALRVENGELRARMTVLEAAVAAMTRVDEQPATGRHQTATRLTMEEEALIGFGFMTIPATGWSAAAGYIRSESHGVRFAAQQGRAQAVRVRLSFASTLCALIESRAHDGEVAALRRAQQSALQIHRSLESPGYVPLSELDDLRSLLKKLALRIELIAQLSICDADGAVRFLPVVGGGTARRAMTDFRTTSRGTRDRARPGG